MKLAKHRDRRNEMGLISFYGHSIYDAAERYIQTYNEETTTRPDLDNLWDIIKGNVQAVADIIAKVEAKVQDGRY